MQKMNFAEFVLYMKENISDYLPESYRDARIDVNHNVKNNDTVKTGITVIKKGVNAGPTIYAEDYYGAYYDAGIDIDSIMKTAGMMIQSNDNYKDIDIKHLTDYESVKESIAFKVVNADSNRKFLETLPHKTVKDLAFIYEVDVTINNKKGSMKINYGLLNEYNISEEELHETAMRNTERLYPGYVRNMNEVITELMVEKLTAQARMTGIEFSKEAIEKTARETISVYGDEDKPPMYVVTNTKMINGAGVMFYPGMMDKIAKELGGNYFVIPSSVHEIIVIPDTKDITPEELNGMIQEVNANELAPDEYLSDHSYYYDSHLRELLTDKEYGYVKEIIKNIKNEGYTPTKKLVGAMLKSAQLCGFVSEIEDLRKAQNMKVIKGEPRAVITSAINELNRQDMVNQKPQTPPVPEGN